MHLASHSSEESPEFQPSSLTVEGSAWNRLNRPRYCRTAGGSRGDRRLLASAQGARPKEEFFLSGNGSGILECGEKKLFDRFGRLGYSKDCLSDGLVRWVRSERQEQKAVPSVVGVWKVWRLTESERRQGKTGHSASGGRNRGDDAKHAWTLDAHGRTRTPPREIFREYDGTAGIRPVRNGLELGGAVDAREVSRRTRWIYGYRIERQSRLRNVWNGWFDPERAAAFGT